MRAKGLPNVVVNLGIFSLTIAVLLVAAEFGVRYLFRDVTTTSDNRSYFAERW